MFRTGSGRRSKERVEGSVLSSLAYNSRITHMADTLTLDLRGCDQEPIHVPGAIQPYGLLFVVDQASDLILQAAGDAASIVSHKGSARGETLQRVLGGSLGDLLRQTGMSLSREPTYLGTFEAVSGQGHLTIVAHKVQGAVVVEIEPAGTPASAARTLANIRSITELISGAPDLLGACRLAAREVRRITSYDRVMIYKFLSDGTGEVIAEEKEDHLNPFLHHRYPASDIPKQARDLYRRNAIRVIPDVGYIPARVEPALCPTDNQPLDMSLCILRSVSPVHIRYLKNMGVGASMSVSLLQRNELWGLIACHNSAAKFVPYEAQETCRHVGEVLSQQIQAREELHWYRSEHDLALASNEVLNSLSGENVSTTLLTLCTALQSVVPSQGIAVCWRGEVARAGSVPSEVGIRNLATWLVHEMAGSEVYTTDCLSEAYPEAGAFTAEASGLLSIVLPSEQPTVIMWFRPEQLEEIKWAGNPHEPVEPASNLGVLNPRRSFDTWRETVRGHSTPWGQVAIESARVFRSRAAYVLQQQRVRELNELLAQANHRLSALVTTDALTGAANRRAFDENLAREWRRAARLRSPLALIAADLDYFKQYNDHFGHLMGDECLKQMVQVLNERCRAGDLPARTGGEEFSILLPGTGLEGAAAVAEAIRERLEKLKINHPTSPLGIVTASFGVAALTPNSTAASPQELMHAADQALYESKKSGRNRVTRG